jgi:hypothetical protein
MRRNRYENMISFAFCSFRRNVMTVASFFAGLCFPLPNHIHHLPTSLWTIGLSFLSVHSGFCSDSTVYITIPLPAPIPTSIPVLVLFCSQLSQPYLTYMIVK